MTGKNEQELHVARRAMNSAYSPSHLYRRARRRHPRPQGYCHSLGASGYRVAKSSQASS